MKVFVHDEFKPEDNAMLQALYSRSPASVEDHIAKVASVGSGGFMEKFYCGYGHQSIGDCGSTTIFLEDVSMLVAKAIQDWPLYSGQEASTRYMDMTKVRIVNPDYTQAGRDILDAWMNFYNSSQAEVEKHVCSRYPIKPDEPAAVYAKAVKARVFDILRGFLPAGVCTQVSWHTNLRQAHDHLSLLKYHPLEEVREAAVKILAALQIKYPNSFSHREYLDQEDYWRRAATLLAYSRDNYHLVLSTDRWFARDIDLHEVLKLAGDLLTNRPPKTVLPHVLSSLGHFEFSYLLDFGSFRDAQRHRNGVTFMPLLTTHYGFHNWYLNQLPLAVRHSAVALKGEQERRISELAAPLEIKQYYTAMGYLVPCHTVFGLPAAVYVAELRSSKYVHPTYRKIAQWMGSELANWCPQMSLHVDHDPDDWDVRRGKHDITEKGTS